MNIGQRLRKIRKSKRLSLGDVQERTGMHASHLSRVETGRIVPSLETLQRWAWALDAQMYEFFLEDGQNAPPAAVTAKSSRLLDSRAERLLGLFDRMDVRNQDLILSLAESADKHLPRPSGEPARRRAPAIPASFNSARNGNRGLEKLAGHEAQHLHTALAAGENG